jgi:hypothetical protein
LGEGEAKGHGKKKRCTALANEIILSAYKAMGPSIANSGKNSCEIRQLGSELPNLAKPFSRIAASLSQGGESHGN